MRGALLLTVLTVVGLVALQRRRLRLALLAGTAGAAVVVAGLALTRPAWPPPGWFLVACDVGQGDAVVLNAGEGSAVVVDAGPEPALIDRCLKDLGVRQVPLLLLSHPHADHVDGLSGVVRGRPVGVIQIGFLDDPERPGEDVLAQVSAAGVPVERAALGQERAVGSLRWAVLGPGRGYRGTSSDPNNSSLVLRVTVGPTTVLLTGDIEPEAQRELLTRRVDVRADVLKVPHHGSEAQEPAFLDAVGASVTLTSVGADNSYGHPSADILGRLLAGGARSFRTDLDGDIALAHRQGRLVAVGRKGSGSAKAPSLVPAVGPDGQ
jgi:competence protein ComEC